VIRHFVKLFVGVWLIVHCLEYFVDQSLGLVGIIFMVEDVAVNNFGDKKLKEIHLKSRILVT
jgi:hypothetical protein